NHPTRISAVRISSMLPNNKSIERRLVLEASSSMSPWRGSQTPPAAQNPSLSWLDCCAPQWASRVAQQAWPKNQTSINRTRDVLSDFLSPIDDAFHRFLLAS